MDVELIAESICGADPALLLGGSAADVGLANRAVAWLADVRSALFQPSTGSGNIPDHSERIAQLSRALDLVAGCMKASQNANPTTIGNLALEALQEGAHLARLLSASQSTPGVLPAAFEVSADEGAVEAIARAVRTKQPGGLLMVPTAFGLMILRRGGSGALASQDQFVAGVATSGPGLRFHPARPREDGDMERMQPLVPMSACSLRSFGSVAQCRHLIEIHRAFMSESFRVHALHYATALPDASSARVLLERVKRNAEALLRARGWSVLSLAELCCCKVAPEKTAAHVAGWCIPAGDCKTAQRIAIRLRTPKGKGHSLLDFESVFGTMLHELAHIVHSKHTPAFYQLMDELQDEWERLEAAGHVLDEQGFPTVGGRRIDTRHNPTVVEGHALALAAAEKRERLGKMMSSGQLGYGNEPASWRTLPARERAARAAERRAKEAALGFGEEELPENLLASTAAVVTSDISETTGKPSKSAKLEVHVSQKRKFCRNACQCGQCDIDSEKRQRISQNTDVAAEEERLVQLAIAASLDGLMYSVHTTQAKEAKEPLGVSVDGALEHPCIEISDDEIDQKKILVWISFETFPSCSKLLISWTSPRLGRVPRERMALGTFWYLACQPPKRDDLSLAK
eukprot:symbB.v1.2.015320.t1/scaffold1138.1/size205980/19